MRIVRSTFTWSPELAAARLVGRAAARLAAK